MNDFTFERIMQLGFGFWGSKTLLSAVELGVFTELAKGSLNAEALSSRLQLHPRGARDFLDALVALGMLQRSKGEYSNTPETDLFSGPRQAILYRRHAGDGQTAGCIDSGDH